MRITLFTAEQANHLLPELRPILSRLVSLKQEADRLDQQIAVLSMAATGAAAANPDARELKRLSDGRARLGPEIGRGVAEVQRRGAVVKDLDRGLLDFYTLGSGDRLVFLCWHLGEAEVGHWHALDGGFATRQPLPRTGHDSEPR